MRELSLVDELDGGIVGDQREISVQRRREPADRRTDIAQCGFVRSLSRFEDGRIRLDQRGRAALCVACGDRLDLNPRFSDSPACVHLEPKIDDSEMAAPEAGHDSGLAVDRSALCVHAFKTDKILAGQQQVLMAEEQRIDAVELGEVLSRVLLPGGARRAVKSRE